MTAMDHKNIAKEIFQSALKAVDPYEAVKPYAEKINVIFQNGLYTRLLVAGFGKASCYMAKAIEDEFPGKIDAGVIITKYGHSIEQKCGSAEVQKSFKEKNDSLNKTTGLSNRQGVRIFEAGHPVPDENGIQGTEEIIKLLNDTDEKTLLVCLISGGGSALLVSPYENISLKDKQEITGLLLRAGADINELNTVRKHLSKVKGGRLAEIAYPARVISLIISDVIGDKLDVIASGPTSPDSTTYMEALSVIEKYGLTEKSPQSVLEVLRKGATGDIPETPKADSSIFYDIDNLIIGSNKKALETAKAKADSLELDAEIFSSEITGEAKEVAKELAQKAISIKSSKVQKFKSSVCLISGGETTVIVKGNGLGGRNMELALAFAFEIEGIEGITLLSAGTDGTDGPTDAAGAIVDGQTLTKARSLGLDPQEYLNNNDSYNFFKEIDGLFITGPTGTNVMDIQIIIVGR